MLLANQKTFKVILSKPVNAIIGDGSGKGTIIDNDDNTLIADAGSKKQDITSEAANRSLIVTPNPASNIVNARLNGYSSNATVKLTSMEGKLLKQIPLQGSANL